jgi:hypothetical protein
MVTKFGTLIARGIFHFDNEYHYHYLVRTKKKAQKELWAISPYFKSFEEKRRFTCGGTT